MINVADIMSGYGGYSIGVEQTKNARVVLAIEKDPNTAEVYAKNFPHHPLRVQELGGNSRSLVAELRQIPRLLLHCSPPCQSLSQANQTTRDIAAGLRLVKWYLRLVEKVCPQFWTMEQVNNAHLRAFLESRRVPFCIVDCVDFSVPQHRNRLIAGSPQIVNALVARKGTGPTVLPRDVLSLPHKSTRLTSGTTNVPVKARIDGVRITTGHRPKAAGEGGRPLDEPCHTVFSKPGKVYDTRTGSARKLTPQECLLLQGFPPSFLLDERSVTRSHAGIGNALPPPLSRFILRSVMHERAGKKNSSAIVQTTLRI
jgi:site-specific DNA-cytosine methylase